MQSQVWKPHDMMTHLWKQTSVFDVRMLGSLCDTFTFTTWAIFPRFLSLGNPRIWTLSQTTEVPGFEPVEVFTCKPWDSCSLVDSPTTAKTQKKKKKSLSIYPFKSHTNFYLQMYLTELRTLTPLKLNFSSLPFENQTEGITSKLGIKESNLHHKKTEMEHLILSN